MPGSTAHDSFKSHLSLLYTNADSLRNKIDDLRARITEKPPDIIAITEVYPKNVTYEVQQPELNIPGYSSFFNTIDGRGVAIYTAEWLSATITDFGIPFSDSIWVKVKLKGNDMLLLGCIYRSPNSIRDNTEKLNILLKRAITTKCSHFIVLGDFNYPEINWDTFTCNKDLSHPVSQFLETLRECDLKQQVNEPTHYRPETSPNILDLILTNEEDMVSSIRYLPPLGKSHHLVLSFQANLYTVQNGTTKKFPLYNKANYPAMRDELNRMDWENELKNKNAQEMWDTIYSKLSEVMTHHIPIRSNRSQKNRKLPWFTEHVQTKLKAKKAAFQNYKRYKTNDSYKIYARARNQAKEAVKQAVKAHERRIASDSKTNPKVFFSYARSKLNVRQGVHNLLDDKGNTISDDGAKANVLNNYFSTVFTVEESTSLPDMDIRLFSSQMTEVNFTQEDVRKKLNELNQSKSAGPDGIHPRILKELSKELCLPLFLCFRASLLQGIVPEQWKTARVTALHKKGSKSDPRNYRPISLTSVVAKVLEKFVRDAIYMHLVDNNLLSKNQHGFTSGRSTNTNLLSAVDEWTREKDKGTTMHVIYLDFSKAFDSVPHERLLLKLTKYGLAGNLLQWLRAFLTGRNQCVSVNGSLSSQIVVKSGIPQGSVLGPILFNIFVNDLPDVVSSTLLLFADDGKLYRAIKSVEDCQKLQTDLTRLEHWADTWQLHFNPEKCKVLKIGQTQSNYHYRMSQSSNCIVLDDSDAEKDLGVWVDSKLRFDLHAEKAASKASSLVGMIRRSYSYLDTYSMSLLFKSLCRPILEYGNIIWYPQYIKDAELIENVQRRASKLIPGLRNKSYSERLKELRLPSLVYRRERGDVIEVYKHLHGYYNYDFHYLQQSRTITRGHSLSLTKEYAKCQCRYHFFAIRVVDMWNNLPETIVKAPNLNTFKNSLDAHWQHCTYSLTSNSMRSQLSKTKTSQRIISY